MKNIIYLWSIFLLLFISCSKDNDTPPPNPATSTLLKKRIYTDKKGVATTYQYVYDGKKIISLSSSDSTQTVYTYTGDLIAKVENKDKKNVVIFTREYSYNTDGKLTTLMAMAKDATSKTKTVYTHHTNETISYESFTVNNQTGEERLSTTGLYTFKDGNLVEMTYSNGLTGYQTVTYEYDTQHNTSKNIIGYNSLIPAVNKNNITKITSIGAFNSTVTLYSYTYDGNGFPIEQKASINGEPDFTVQFSY